MSLDSRMFAAASAVAEQALSPLGLVVDEISLQRGSLRRRRRRLAA